MVVNWSWWWWNAVKCRRADLQNGDLCDMWRDKCRVYFIKPGYRHGFSSFPLEPEDHGGGDGLNDGVPVQPEHDGILHV